MDQYRDILQSSSLFKNIIPEDFENLLTCLSPRYKGYQRQEVIFHVDSPAGDVGIVCSGGVQVIREDFIGNRTILAKLEDGDIFGEAFACAGIHRLPVAVISQQDSVIAFLDYRKIITGCPKSCGFHSRLIENMMEILAKKNVFLNQRIEILSKRTTREKLIAFLSTQAQAAQSHSFSIPFSRQELADYLCVDRSAMSTELGKLKKSGLVDFDKNSFTIKDLTN